MALNKQNISLPLGIGLDTKTDSLQVNPNKLLDLENAVFNKGGLLQKRNGYQNLTSLPTNATTLTTFNGNLVTAGGNLQALLQGGTTWVTQGSVASIALNTLPIVRSSTSQIYVDTAVSTINNLLCSVWVDSASNAYYQISDSITGQVAIAPVALPSTVSRVRVFSIGNYFMVVFIATVSGASHLQYIAVPLRNPTVPLPATDISTQVSSLTAAFDGIVANNNLYLSWNGSDGGGALRTRYITPFLGQSTAVAEAGITSSIISITADTTGNLPVIWVTFNQSNIIKSIAYSSILASVLTSTTVNSASSVSKITSIASDQLLNILYENGNNYTVSSIPSDFISINTITQAGATTSVVPFLRSVGLGTKAFSIDGEAYVGLAYGSATSGLLQPTYFISDLKGNLIAKLAYSNGGGYYPNYILPSVTVNGEVAYFGYLYKDLTASANPAFLTPPSTTGNIYSQTGINLAALDFTPKRLSTSEIGHNLLLGGGFLWMYDGIKAVEQNFHLFPEDLTVSTATGSGGLIAQDYYYQAVYEWTDGQGNIHRSAPSIPIKQTTSTTNSTNTIHVPTLRLTYKISNPVRITLYRWSTAQQLYYQITSITSPVLNNTTVDVVTIVDTASDASILGNNLLYTTGSVIEDTGGPASSVLTLFKSRLFMVDAEDQNLLWYSKQVIEGTPVEMSDLLTLYVAPTTGAQGSTGNVTALAPMDDKLIIFKPDAIYYVVGNGPDNTGSNNDFSDPIFITSTVGCANPQSIVLMNNGLMFQSDKGIWLLGRDLSTSYIGAPVEKYNGYTITSANTIPGTNEVRFTLNANIILMYDYFFGQWGTFNTTQALSGTLYQGLHTLLTSTNNFVYQESPGSYLDGSSPVLMTLTTAWLSFAGLQGYERAYYFFLLGQYLSPHKIQIQIAYDYDASTVQSTIISPDNYSAPYGTDNYFGDGSPFGGPSTQEQWRVFMDRQKCQSFQITLSELIDGSHSQSGAGFTLSAFNFVIGAKSGYARLRPSRSVG